MSSVVISGDTSGAITLSAPAVAGTNTITLPASTGTVVLSGTTPSLNGITFPATQVPSADANTLDDYEEGTWTPTKGSGLTVVGTFSSSGKYTKIGNTVTVYGFVAATTSMTCGNGSSSFGGLPFSSNNIYCNGVLVNGNITQLVGLQVDGATGIFSTAITSTTGAYFSITYMVS